MSQGLEGVVVAETEISGIDGEAGRLWVRGLDIEDLAGHASFEATVGLLWDGALPDAEGQESIRAALGAGRLRCHEMLPSLGTALRAADAMEALRGLTASYAPKNLEDESEWPIALTAALPVFAAAWYRTQQGQEPISPDPKAGHAEDFLRLLHGVPPNPAKVAALDRYLVTVAEHGMNASTFTARVVASTQADPVSVITAALGALKGPLHGGAPGPVLDLLDSLGEGQDPELAVRAELKAGRRIMGMGHRVYRVRDPRAAVLEASVRTLEEAGIASTYLARARELESAATRVLTERHPDRPIAANVEFYTAVLLDTLGFPRELFTAIFAIARVAGWFAHDAEQRSEGRILRPRQRYIGARPDAPVAAA